MDAIRAMIDGLEDWFKRQEAKLSSQLSALRPDPGPSDGAQVKPGVTQDAPDFRGITDVVGVEGETDVDPSVGDFGGRPSIGLPESRHDGYD
jgi:hypothetical protein